jgi:hypothetical protein
VVVCGKDDGLLLCLDSNIWGSSPFFGGSGWGGLLAITDGVLAIGLAANIAVNADMTVAGRAAAPVRSRMVPISSGVIIFCYRKNIYHLLPNEEIEKGRGGGNVFLFFDVMNNIRGEGEGKKVVLKKRKRGREGKNMKEVSDDDDDIEEDVEILEEGTIQQPQSSTPDIGGISADRAAGHRTMQPVLKYARDWSPFKICRDLELVSAEITQTKEMVERARWNKHTANGTDSISANTRDEIIRRLEDLNTFVHLIAKNTHGLITDAVSASCVRLYNPEVLGNGPLIPTQERLGTGTGTSSSRRTRSNTTQRRSSRASKTKSSTQLAPIPIAVAAAAAAAAPPQPM